MRASNRAVLDAAEAWDDVYQNGDYDGAEGSLARIVLSDAVEKMRAERTARTVKREDTEPSAFVSEDGFRFVRQADGSYLCDGSKCGEGANCGTLYDSFEDARNCGALDFATFEP